MADERFARVFVPWLRLLRKMGVLSNQAAVFLALCTWVHDEGANPWSGLPRKDIADMLGISERSVSEAVRGLVAKGAIRHMRGGHAHRASDYYLMPGIALGTSATRTKNGFRYVWQPHESTCGTRTSNKKKGGADAYAPDRQDRDIRPISIDSWCLPATTEDGEQDDGKENQL